VVSVIQIAFEHIVGRNHKFFGQYLTNGFSFSSKVTNPLERQSVKHMWAASVVTGNLLADNVDKSEGKQSTFATKLVKPVATWEPFLVSRVNSHASLTSSMVQEERSKKVSSTPSYLLWSKYGTYKLRFESCFYLCWKRLEKYFASLALWKGISRLFSIRPCYTNGKY